MQYIRSILILLTLTLRVGAAEISEEVQELQDDYKGRMKVWAITDDYYENSRGNEYFVLKFESRQDTRDNNLNYEMHVTVQLTDKKTELTGYAQIVEVPGPIRDVDNYADHTAWEFRIPFGNMKKPKMTACVIEFGFVKKNQFIPIAVDCDDVDSPEEIIDAGGVELDIKCKRSSHHYWSNN